MVDIAPKMAGTLYGVADLFYAANGFVVPLISSVFVTDFGVAVQWRFVWLFVIVSNVLFVVIYTLLCKSEESDFSIKLERQRRPSEWVNLPGDRIAGLEKRMQREHPHLKYNRRSSKVEPIHEPWTQPLTVLYLIVYRNVDTNHLTSIENDSLSNVISKHFLCKFIKQLCYSGATLSASNQLK